MNMQSSRVYGELVGTKLLEGVASRILYRYLDLGVRSVTCLFGTVQSDSGLYDKIKDLCDRLGERIYFETRENSRTLIAAQDDKLDTVAGFRSQITCQEN